MATGLTIDDLVIIGIKGTVLALEKATGQEIWRTPLKGGEFVNVWRDGDRILATARGEIFCLDATDGRLLWVNPLKGMGYGYITIAGAAQLPPAVAQADEAAAASQVTTASHSPT